MNPGRDEHDEKECLYCGCLVSACVCTRRAPTDEELELARDERLSRAERGRGEP
jgi:hypothetical protein